MGLTNVYAKLLIVACLLFPLFSWGQATTTTIPGKLKIKTVPHAPALQDSMLTIDINGNVKKDTIPSGGGSAANGVNGLTGTGNIGLGGTLSQNTTINANGFNFIVNQPSAGPYIQQWQFNSSNVAGMDGTGNLNLNGIRYLGNGNTGRIDFTGGSTAALRNAADNGTAFQAVLLNTAATGYIALFQNYAYSTFSIGQGVTQSPFTKIGYNMLGGLKPVANGDTLVGMYIRPLFGTSTINGINTIVGGSGYPNGTRLSNVSGGTGRSAVIQVTVSGGAVTGASIISGGVNYTVGDVLHVVLTDGTGTPVGSGGSVTVSSVTSYSGITKWALVTAGLDQYESDVSSTYTPESKTSKRYVDSRLISNSYSATGSATTTFTVTIGATQPNNTYKVQVTPTSVIASGSGYYVTNKTTTTFQVVYPSGLTGAVSFDWSVAQ